MAAQLPEQIRQHRSTDGSPVQTHGNAACALYGVDKALVIWSGLSPLGLSHSSHAQPHSTPSVPRTHSALTWKHSPFHLHSANSFSSFKSQSKCSRKAFAYALCSTYHTWLNPCLPLSNPITMGQCLLLTVASPTASRMAGTYLTCMNWKKLTGLLCSHFSFFTPLRLWLRTQPGPSGR